MLNKSLRVWAPWFGMGCKAQTTAIAQLWRGFATPQTAQNRDDRAARDLFSVALTRHDACSSPPAKRYYAGGRGMSTTVLRDSFQSLLGPAKQMQAQYLPQIQQKGSTLDAGQIMAMLRGA